MNEQTKLHIQQALEQGIRLDGRKLDEFRELSFELNVVRNAEGSAKVSCGGTEVLAGVKLGLGAPFSDRPENGALMVNAELLPMSSPRFEAGPPGIDAIEASRVIDRGIRESKSVDEKKLCVIPGEKVWIVNVDVYPLNFDGNFIDIGGIAAAAATKIACFPSVVDKQADYKHMTKDKVPMKVLPIPITVCKIGSHLLVDPTEDEEAATDCRLTITTIDNGEVCSLQKGGDAAITLDELDAMIDLAVKKGKEIRAQLAKAIK